MRTIHALAVALLLAACVTQEQAFQRQTAGHVGCPPDQIVIRDIAQSTWTAICHGRWYYCANNAPTDAEMLLGVRRTNDAVTATCTPSSGRQGNSDDE